MLFNLSPKAILTSTDNASDHFHSMIHSRCKKSLLHRRRHHGFHRMSIRRQLSLDYREFFPRLNENIYMPDGMRLEIKTHLVIA
jgi:hypothetical protein